MLLKSSRRNSPMIENVSLYKDPFMATRKKSSKKKRMKTRSPMEALPNTAQMTMIPRKANSVLTVMPKKRKKVQNLRLKRNPKKNPRKPRKKPSRLLKKQRKVLMNKTMMHWFFAPRLRSLWQCVFCQSILVTAVTKVAMTSAPTSSMELTTPLPLCLTCPRKYSRLRKLPRRSWRQIARRIRRKTSKPTKMMEKKHFLSGGTTFRPWAIEQNWLLPSL